MADGFKAHRTKDGRVFVILHPNCAITKEAVLALLAELGIDESGVIFLQPEEVAENCAGFEDVPVVIPIEQACCDAPELDEAGLQCGQVGGRLIVLFGESFPYDGLHPIAEKYGTQCAWSADQLEDCINDIGSAPPRDGGGSAVARPKPEQVKC